MSFVKRLFRALLEVVWGLTKLVSTALFAAFLVILFIMAGGEDVRIPTPPRPLPAYIAPISISPDLNWNESTATRSADINDRTNAMRRATVIIQMPKALGSGVVIDNKQCLVITNHHVIDEPGDIKVAYIAAYRNDGSPIVVTTPAEMVAYPDPQDDLALIRMESCAGLPWAPLADSSRTFTLEPVFAVGAPRGLSWSFTEGKVSHTRRAVWDAARGSGELLIQTDTAINPGNSGGPLFDRFGYVVGINSLGVRGGENLNFAHSSNAVKVYLAQVAEYGYLPRYPLGIEDAVTQSFEAAVEANLPADYINAGSFGVKVETVSVGSAAEAAGLLAGDILIAADNEGLYSYEQLRRLLYAHGPGNFAVKVWREGNIVELTLTIATPEVGKAPWAQPEPTASEETPAPAQS